jgi:hypothetical protein
MSKITANKVIPQIPKAKRHYSSRQYMIHHFKSTQILSVAVYITTRKSQPKSTVFSTDSDSIKLTERNRTTLQCLNVSKADQALWF